MFASATTGAAGKCRDEPSVERRRASGHFAALGLIVLIAAIARVRGAMNELWLDEVWSVELARNARSLLDVFTSLHNENNHYLNTIWLRGVGEVENALWYRLPAIMAGIGSTILAALIGARRGRANSILAALLFGFSYPLVLYGSEARGYASGIFFALAVYYVQPLAAERRRFATPAFAAINVLGLLSHLGFVSVMLASLAWSFRLCWRAKRQLRPAVLEIARLHLLPWLLFGLLLWVDIRNLRDGEGTVVASFIDSFGSAFAWTVGTTLDKTMQLMSCVIAVVFLVAGLRQLEGSESDKIVFFVGAIIVFPLILLVVRRSEIVYVRYFIFGMAFVLLLVSDVLAAWFRRGGAGRMAALSTLVLFLWANFAEIAQLFAYGRGTYGEPLRLIAKSAPPEVKRVRLGSDEDFRTWKAVAFHGRIPSEIRPIDYQLDSAWPKEGCDFVIMTKESSVPRAEPPDVIRDKFGNGYRFVKEYRTAPLSGMQWLVYAKDSP